VTDDELGEREFLAGYSADDYPAVAVTVDVVVLTVRDAALHVLLVRRGEHPYRGRWALPGGFLRPDESLDRAAARELADETGLTAATAAGPGGSRVHLEQLATTAIPAATRGCASSRRRTSRSRRTSPRRAPGRTPRSRPGCR
jgi:8-oxo-dGTP diphosphatase